MRGFSALFVYTISDIVTDSLCLDLLESLSRTKGSTVGSCKSRVVRFVFKISSSFLALHIYRESKALVHRPLLSLSPNISHPEIIHSIQYSPINRKQQHLTKGGYQIIRQREETTHSGLQLPKEINNHLMTRRQIGDSQPFSPLELITMYVG